MTIYFFRLYVYNQEVTEQTRPNFCGLFRSKEGLWLVNIEQRCLNNADFLNFWTFINVYRIREIFSFYAEKIKIKALILTC